jgi:uncharacterized membrane protein
MKLAVGIIGGLAMLSYFFGMALAWCLGDDGGTYLRREKKAAAWSIVGGWILTCFFVSLGMWGQGDSNGYLTALAWVTVYSPLIALILCNVRHRWVPALFLLFGIVSAPITYFMLILK